MLVAAAMFVVAPTAPAADTLVLESHVGVRPRDADRVLTPLRSALQKRGFVVMPAAVAKTLSGSRILPTEPKQDLSARELAEAFERARGDWLDGRIERAATRLEAAISAAHRAPQVLAFDQKTRELLFSALISLAQARNRQGQQAKGEAAMAELIRSFPGQLITRGEHGPEAFALYGAVRRGLDTEGRGGLIVKVNVPSAIFLDEEPRTQGVDGVRIADLVAGEYRLLVQSADDPTAFRFYKVPIYAHQVTHLDVNWELDSVLVTDEWVGFRYDSSMRQAKEEEIALRLAREAAMPAVVTLQLGTGKDARRIRAKVYSRGERGSCSGSMRLQGKASDDEQAAGLARTLDECLEMLRLARTESQRESAAGDTGEAERKPALPRASSGDGVKTTPPLTRRREERASTEKEDKSSIPPRKKLKPVAARAGKVL